MKTELLTFQTTVRVTYDTALAGARAAAIRAAKDLMGELPRSTVTASAVDGTVTAEPKWSKLVTLD